MPLLSDSDNVYLGGTPLNAVYLGGAKVWSSGPAGWQAHDEPDRTITLTTNVWADVPAYPASVPVSVALSPGYRSGAHTVDCRSWHDSAGATKNLTNGTTQGPLKETELVAMVDGPGVVLYTRYGIWFAKAAA
jgi:hypothetical protein